MAKVLISFLGASKENNGYRKANYRLSDTWHRESTFIQEVLTKYFHTDRMILVGTVGSMWEKVYESFAGKSMSQSVYNDLKEVCVHATPDSPLSLPHLDKLEGVLGNGSKVILIKYGLNSEEIQYNDSVILGLERYLRDGDELFIDITHSFRSLPMIIMNTLIFLKTVSKKHIEIEHITYGMYEATDKNGFTPVVEMNSLMDTVDWISGAYSFMEFGNAYKIANLLKSDYKRRRAILDNEDEEEEREKQLYELLHEFSEVKNLNLLKSIEQLKNELKEIRMETEVMPDKAKRVVPEVTNQFLEYFEGANNTAKFQYRLACWYQTKHNYSSAYLVTVEAIVSLVCLRKGWDDSDRETRDRAKDALFNEDALRPLRRIFIEVNEVRKQIAHSMPGEANYQQKIKLLNDKFLALKPYFS